MVYKLYILEIVGNLPILFGVLSAGIIFKMIILSIIEPNKKEDGGYRGYITSEECQAFKYSVNFINRIKRLSYLLIMCLTIAILTPSKTFMYSALGIQETINFIQGNEEVKEMSSKVLKVINMKLDKYIEPEIKN